MTELEKQIDHSIKLNIFKPGERVKTNNWGDVIILGCIKIKRLGSKDVYKRVVKFVNTGNVTSSTNSDLSTGRVADSKEIRRRSGFYVGYEFKTNNFGIARVEKIYPKSYSVDIKFLNTGNKKYGIGWSSFKTGSVRDNDSVAFESGDEFTGIDGTFRIVKKINRHGFYECFFPKTGYSCVGRVKKILEGFVEDAWSESYAIRHNKRKPTGSVWDTKNSGKVKILTPFKTYKVCEFLDTGYVKMVAGSTFTSMLVKDNSLKSLKVGTIHTIDLGDAVVIGSRTPRFRTLRTLDNMHIVEVSCKELLLRMRGATTEDINKIASGLM